MPPGSAGAMNNGIPMTDAISTGGWCICAAWPWRTLRSWPSETRTDFSRSGQRSTASRTGAAGAPPVPGGAAAWLHSARSTPPSRPSGADERRDIGQRVAARAPNHAGHAPRPAATPASPGAWRVRSWAGAWTPCAGSSAAVELGLVAAVRRLARHGTRRSEGPAHLGRTRRQPPGEPSIPSPSAASATVGPAATRPAATPRPGGRWRRRWPEAADANWRSWTGLPRIRAVHPDVGLPVRLTVCAAGASSAVGNRDRRPVAAGHARARLTRHRERGPAARSRRLRRRCCRASWPPARARHKGKWALCRYRYRGVIGWTIGRTATS